MMAGRLTGLSPLGKLTAALATACTVIARQNNCPGVSDGPGKPCALFGIDCPCPQAETDEWETKAIPVMAECWRRAFMAGLVGSDGVAVAQESVFPAVSADGQVAS